MDSKTSESKHTKKIVAAIRGNKIPAFRSLLSDVSHNLPMRLNSTERLSLLYECIKIVHALDEVINIDISLRLRKDNLGFRVSCPPWSDNEDTDIQTDLECDVNNTVRGLRERMHLERRECRINA